MPVATECTALLGDGRKDPGMFDDVVTLNYKNLGYVWVQASFWWLVGLTLSVAGMDGSDSVSRAAVWVLLLGTIWGLIGSALVLRGTISHTTIMLDESLRRLQQSGVRVSHTHVAISSFPLMRLLLCLVGVSLALFLFTFISEILCVFLCSGGLSGVVEAMLPLLLFICLGATFLSCLKTVSLVFPIVGLLLVIQVIFFIIKFKDSRSTLPWIVTFSPYWIFLIFCGGGIIRTLAKSTAGDVRLSTFNIVQILLIAVAIYIGLQSTFQICGLSLSISNAFDTLWHRSNGRRPAKTGTVVFSQPWVWWIISVWILYVSFAATCVTKWFDHANRRGYVTPLNIERTTQGWEPVPEAAKQRPVILIV